jgi:hypothetical protein
MHSKSVSIGSYPNTNAATEDCWKVRSARCRVVPRGFVLMFQLDSTLLESFSKCTLVVSCLANQLQPAHDHAPCDTFRQMCS